MFLYIADTAAYWAKINKGSITNAHTIIWSFEECVHYTSHSPTPPPTEYVPCPVYECKDGKQEIVQQPADLTTLSANLAMAAANFVDKQAG